MPPLSIMIKPASGLCNLRCKYCFYADEMKNRKLTSYGIMGEETLESVIRETLSFAEKSCTIAFQGGEPSLAGIEFFRKCLALEQKYNCNQVKISHGFQTNGYYIDREWCAFFAENDFLVGLSVDGMKSTHDAFRVDAAGEGTYLRTLECARLLKETGVQFNILTVVNGKTAPKIRKIYDQYQKYGFNWQQYIACLDGFSELAGGAEYTLSPQAYGRCLVELFELWEADFYRGRQPYIRQFENWIGMLMGYYPEACEQRGICSFQGVIEADGSIYPCDFYVLDEYRLGNLKEDGFEKIVERWTESGFRKNSEAQPEECKRCRYHTLCRGGCRRHRERPGGILGKNKFCESYRMFFEACLPRMKKVAEVCIKNERRKK